MLVEHFDLGFIDNIRYIEFGGNSATSKGAILDLHMSHILMILNEIFILNYLTEVRIGTDFARSLYYFCTNSIVVS